MNAMMPRSWWVTGESSLFMQTIYLLPDFALYLNKATLSASKHISVYLHHYPSHNNITRFVGTFPKTGDLQFVSQYFFSNKKKGGGDITDLNVYYHTHLVTLGHKLDTLYEQDAVLFSTVFKCYHFLSLHSITLLSKQGCVKWLEIHEEKPQSLCCWLN